MLRKLQIALTLAAVLVLGMAADGQTATVNGIPNQRLSNISYIDMSGNTTTGYWSMAGVTSGAGGFTVGDVAGTSVLYILPTTNGTTNQILSNGGTATCPTLASGAPTNCVQLNWSTASSSGSNTCTDNPSPGALGATNTAGHTYCLGAGTYTLAAAQTISAANVTILCTNPAAIIQVTGATNGFNISGNDDQIIGCTLDHNSQTAAGTGPLINITGNRTIVERNTFQNVGVTNSATATVYITAGTGHRISYNYWVSSADTMIWINNATASTTISDIVVQGNRVASFNPGTAALNGFYAKGILSTSQFVERVSWLDNIMHCSGANANCMAQNFDISPTGTGGNFGHVWRGNKVIVEASVADVYHWFGNYHSTFSENTAILALPATAGVSKFFSFGDTYFSTISRNVIHNPSGFYTGDMVFADFMHIVVEGNVIDGGTANSSTSGGIYLFSTSGAASHAIISNNHITIQAAFASPCIRLESATSGFTTVDNQIIGNHCTGTGTAGQIGIQLVDTTGTFQNTFIDHNYINNVPVGISVGAGVTGTRIGMQSYESVTTAVSDSNTTSPLTARSNALEYYANASSTGTLTNGLVKVNGANQVVRTATTDLNGAIGICVFNCGTTGQAQIALTGNAYCVFDNTTVAGDWVQISSSTAGDCHDSGSTYPGGGAEVIGVVLDSGAAGTHMVTLIFNTPTIYSGTVNTPVTSTSNTTAEQNMMATTIPAGYMNQAGKMLHVWTQFSYTTGSAAAGTHTWKAKLCSVSGCGSGTVITLGTWTSGADANSITNGRGELEIWASTVSTGATGTVEPHGKLSIVLATTNNTPAVVYFDTNSAVTSTFDLTAAYFLQITATFSVNGSPANSQTIATERQLFAEVR